jgi:hypothetical protein
MRIILEWIFKKYMMEQTQLNLLKIWGRVAEPSEHGNEFSSKVGKYFHQLNG